MDNDEEVCGGLSLFCWGSGQFGQHGHAIEDAIPFLEGHVARFEGRAKLVSCGASHTVVVTESNEVFAWGNGQNGQLGSGFNRQLLSPTRMKFKLAGPHAITGVSCGDRHTCLLLEDGRVLCCGSNFYAQLSYDLMQPQYRKDLLLPTLMPLAQRVLQITCGQHHTILLCENGEVSCIGRNMYGQIGVPSEDSRNDCFEKPKRLVGAFGTAPIERIAAGGNHSLCIDRNGDAYCWGYGRACGLRQGHVMNPVKLSSGQRVAAVDGGGSHSVLLTDEGQLWAIGSNADGQCGLGSNDLFLPSLTLLPCEPVTGVVSAFACGENFTVASGSLGVFAWGKNSNVINDGDVGLRIFNPVPLAGPDCEVRTIAAGTWHAAALLAGATAPPPPPPPAEAQAPLAARAPSPGGEQQIGLKRERTRITLAELYAPTPTPRPFCGFSEDEEDEDEDGDKEEEEKQNDKEDKEKEKEGETAAEDEEEEEEEEVVEQLRSSPPTPASFFGSGSSSSVLPSPSPSFPSSTSSPSSLRPTPPPNMPRPLDLIRVPSPPVLRPLQRGLRREALSPLQVTGGEGGVTEDVFLLPARAAAPAIRRRTAEPQRPALGRREPSGISRERSLVIPRTLTFVLNDRKEAVTTERPQETRRGPLRPPVMRPALRRAYTTLSRAPET